MAVEYVPSRMTVLEENMEWLTRPRLMQKERGFFIVNREVEGFYADPYKTP